MSVLEGKTETPSLSQSTPSISQARSRIALLREHGSLVHAHSSQSPARAKPAPSAGTHRRRQSHAAKLIIATKDTASADDVGNDSDAENTNRNVRGTTSSSTLIPTLTGLKTPAMIKQRASAFIAKHSTETIASAKPKAAGISAHTTSSNSHTDSSSLAITANEVVGTNGTVGDTSLMTPPRPSHSQSKSNVWHYTSPSTGLKLSYTPLPSHSHSLANAHSHGSADLEDDYQVREQNLLKLRDQLLKWDESLQSLKLAENSRIEQKERRLEEKSSAINDIKTALEAREIELHEREMNFNIRQNDFEQREKSLNQNLDHLESSRKEITLLRQQLLAKNAELDQKLLELNSQQSQSRYSQQCQSLESELELEVKQVALTKRESDLVEREDRMQKLIADKESEIRDRENQMQQRERELSRELEEHSSQLCCQQERELQQREEALCQRESELDEIKQQARVMGQMHCIQQQAELSQQLRYCQTLLAQYQSTRTVNLQAFLTDVHHREQSLNKKDEELCVAITEHESELSGRLRELNEKSFLLNSFETELKQWNQSLEERERQIETKERHLERYLCVFTESENQHGSSKDSAILGRNLTSELLQAGQR